MIPTIKLDESALNAQMRQFILDTGRDASMVVKDQAGLFLRDLIGATPPFGKHAFSRRDESYNEQRKIGEKAVERDVRKVFMSLAAFIRGIKSPKLAAALAIAGGLGAVGQGGRRSFSARKSDPDAVRAILKNMGVQKDVIEIAQPALHKKARGAHGRVGKRTRSVLVLKDRSIDQYVREVKSHVGKSKSGWVSAAIGLGLKAIPQWIRRHSEPGIFRDETANKEAPAITLGNLTPWTSDFDEGPFQAAIDNRVRAMQIQAQKIVENAYKKHGGR